MYNKFKAVALPGRALGLKPRQNHFHTSLYVFIDTLFVINNNFCTIFEIMLKQKKKHEDY